MQRNILAFVAGASLATGISVGAAPGDLAYKFPRVKTDISSTQSDCHRSCAIAEGSWTGAAADLREVSMSEHLTTDEDGADLLVYQVHTSGVGAGSLEDIAALHVRIKKNIITMGLVE